MNWSTDKEQTALQAYIIEIQNIEGMFRALTQDLQTAKKVLQLHPDKVHWGHVGSASQALELLKEIKGHI